MTEISSKRLIFFLNLQKFLQFKKKNEDFREEFKIFMKKTIWRRYHGNYNQALQRIFADISKNFIFNQKIDFEYPKISFLTKKSILNIIFDKL